MNTFDMINKAGGYANSDHLKLRRVIMLEYSNWEPGMFGLDANDIYQRHLGWDKVIEGMRKLGENTGIQVDLDVDRSVFLKQPKITAINITLTPHE